MNLKVLLIFQLYQILLFLWYKQHDIRRGTSVNLPLWVHANLDGADMRVITISIISIDQSFRCKVLSQTRTLSPFFRFLIPLPLFFLEVKIDIPFSISNKSNSKGTVHNAICFCADLSGKTPGVHGMGCVQGQHSS